MQIEKADLPARRIFGWANIAVTKDDRQIVDHHGDIIDPVDLEEAAYLHVLEYRKGGVDHSGDAPLAELIESMYFDVEKAQALGIPDGTLPCSGWWVGFEFADTPAGFAAWQSVASGDRAWLSIEGLALGEELT
jgi:hypothetical protein